MSSPAAATSSSIIGDVPLTDPKDDRLGRAALAERLAAVISARSDPSSVVFGIYGSWGQGKTTLLNYTEKALRKQGIACLRFNPWLFGEESGLFRVFFDQIAAALEIKPEGVVEGARGLAAKATEKAGWVASLFGVDTTKASDALMGSLEDAKAKLEDRIRAKGRKLVVFMDDIDRLDKREIYLVFRLVKAAADFTHTSYVLAMDHDVVAAALGDRYGAGNERSGKDFLEKVIQVPLTLPVPDRVELLDLCLQGIDSALRVAGVMLTPEQEREFGSAFMKTLAPRLSTPRTARRYANTVEIALGILKDEVNPVDQLLVEGLRVLFPELYSFVQTAPEQFLGDASVSLLSSKKRDQQKKEWKERFDSALVSYREEERAAAVELIETLFPKTGEYLSSYSIVGNEESLRREKRVASPDYFQRYFSYSVLKDDVPDQEVNTYLNGLKAAKPPELKTLLTGRNAHRVIGKIALKVESLDDASTRALVVAIASVGEELPATDGFMGFSVAATRSQGAGLVARLLQELTPIDEAFVTEIASKVSPLLFACEILMWLRAAPSGTTQEVQDSSPLVACFGKSLAARIEREAADQDLVQSHGSAVGRLLYVWEAFGELASLREHVSRSISAGADRALFILGAVGGVDMEDRHYASIQRWTDPVMLLKVLEDRFGPLSGELAARATGDLTRRLAETFYAAHRRAHERAASSEALGTHEADAQRQETRVSPVDDEEVGSDSDDMDDEDVGSDSDEIEMDS